MAERRLGKNLIDAECVKFLLLRKTTNLGRKALELQMQCLATLPIRTRKGFVGASARCCSVARLGRRSLERPCVDAPFFVHFAWP